MPHIIVKLWPGRSEEQKVQLTNEIVKSVMDIVKVEEKSISVAFEEVSPEEWHEKVYKPDILNAENKLYKRPGYFE